jgi:2'-5' RNA ligase
VDTVGGRTAIVVPVALPDALESIRLRHVSNASLGVPAHVTLLFPFVPVASLDPSDIDVAAAVVARFPSFEVGFRDATTFDPTPTDEDVVWLAPQPSEPFVALTLALAEAFPGHPPYEGIHDTVIPHLTLANVDVDAAALTAAARPHLPFTRRVLIAALLVEDDVGRWRVERELPLR